MGVDSVTDEEINEVNAKEFFEAFKAAQKINPNYIYVTLHPIEHYEECRVRLLLIDKTSGLAIEKDGNIISVFKVGNRKRVMNTVMPYAIEKYGGKKLDCFCTEGSPLHVLYSNLGFVPFSKTPFDENFKPEDWNIEKDGTPDIVFWIHKSFLPSEEISKISKIEKLPEFDSYDGAMAYRDELLKRFER